MSAPLPRIVIDNDTPQAVVRAAGMTLLTLAETAARFRISRRTLQGQLDGVPYLCVGRCANFGGGVRTATPVYATNLASHIRGVNLPDVGCKPVVPHRVIVRDITIGARAK
jgi:hypothetical protein